MRRVDSEHGEQVDNWVCVPADNSHKLCWLDLALHNCISCTFGCGRETDEEIVDKVQEEEVIHEDGDLGLIHADDVAPRVLSNL